MEPISVECKFGAEGSVQVSRVLLEGKWRTVEQGRQWFDGQNRHVLVIVNNVPRELILEGRSLRWMLKNRARPGVYVV